MDLLRQFYNDIHTREAVKEFMIANLRETAVEKVFNKGAVAGIYEAKKAIDKSFDKLDELYGIIDKPVITNSR